MEKIHIFERAGLGVAPFSFSSYFEHKTKQGKPGSTCDYCGKSIAIVCIIKDTNGKTFKVGSNCVEKTGDKGMINKAAQSIKEAKRQSDLTKIEDGKKWMEENAKKLSEIQHGKYTLLESMRWYFQHAGVTGKLRIIKFAKNKLETGR